MPREIILWGDDSSLAGSSAASFRAENSCGSADSLVGRNVVGDGWFAAFGR
ncbi:MAG: hypothetical protein WBX22_03290 [Silvibacterium sp.]